MPLRGAGINGMTAGASARTSPIGESSLTASPDVLSSATVETPRSAGVGSAGSEAGVRSAGLGADAAGSAELVEMPVGSAAFGKAGVGSAELGEVGAWLDGVGVA